MVGQGYTGTYCDVGLYAEPAWRDGIYARWIFKPRVWDDIRAINGEVGEYITVAKKSGKDWFIGSMTNSEAREFIVKLDFLDEGKYEAHIFQDAADSHIHAEKLEINKTQVKYNDTFKIKMVSGGGFVAHLKKNN